MALWYEQKNSAKMDLYFFRPVIRFCLVKIQFVVISLKKNISITKILFLTLKGTILSNPINNNKLLLTSNSGFEISVWCRNSSGVGSAPQKNKTELSVYASRQIEEWKKLNLTWFLKPEQIKMKHCTNIFSSPVVLIFWRHITNEYIAEHCAMKYRCW